jgi:hypothetical protein
MAPDSIVAAHGGRLWAENNPAGGGRTFNVALPVSSKCEVHQIRAQRSPILSSHETYRRAAAHKPLIEAIQARPACVVGAWQLYRKSVDARRDRHPSFYISDVGSVSGSEPNPLGHVVA